MENAILKYTLVTMPVVELPLCLDNFEGDVL